MPNDEPASLVEARSVDRLCDRFEAAWRAGPRPAIEAFLADAPASARAAALRELIALEVEYRRRDGETPKPEEYETRFGESSEAIASVFGRRPCRVEEKDSAESGADTPDTSPTVELEEKGTWPTPELPGYDILGRLGAGGMGVVYRARQLSLNRVVALKLIRPDVVAGPRERARFHREAEAAARLQHPHVVQVYEIDEHDGQPFAVLELVQGHTLAKELTAGPLRIRDAAVLVEKLARAVHHAHENGILHRDLKPGNVLMAEDGTPKVADFGLARWLGSPSDQTATGELLGTPKYMAPEQALGQLEQLTAATDIHALGAILYESLTGQPVFQGRTPLETLDQVRTQEPTPPRRLRRDVPRDLEAICLKCLEKSPTARYSSAAGLADDLKRWLSGEPTQARPERWPRRVRRFAWRQRSKVAATVAVTAAVILAVPALFRGPSPEEIEARRQEAALAAIESELAAGRPAELVGETGGPPLYRIRTGAEATQVSVAGENGCFSVHSWRLCLLQLLHNPQRVSYRIRAEIHHDNSKRPGEVGLFFGLEELMAAQGPLLSYGLVAFNDVDSEVDLWRIIPENAPGRPPEPKGNYSCIQACVYGLWPDGSDRRPQRLVCSSPPFVFEPGRQQRGWRWLSIDVNPDRVCAYWEDGRVIGQLTAQEWENSLNKGLANDKLIGRVKPTGFSPTGALGLFVYQSTASFRRVFVEPLGGEASPSSE